MTSCTSVDLPDPLTPVTHVISPSGISTSTFFRLCSVAPAISRRCGPGPPARSRHGDRQFVAQVARGQRARIRQQSGNRTGIDHAAALLAGPEPHVHHLVRHANHVRVVLDDDDGVALIAQLQQDRDQPLVVARMQADRRLVEDVERVDQGGPERRRQIDALRFAAGQRRREPIQRQVVQADVGQESQPPPDLAEDLLRHGGVLFAQRQLPEERLRRPSPSARRRRRSSDRRRARRAPRAAAACRRIPDTSGSRGTG